MNTISTAAAQGSVCLAFPSPPLGHAFWRLGSIKVRVWHSIYGLLIWQQKAGSRFQVSTTAVAAAAAAAAVTVRLILVPFFFFFSFFDHHFYFPAQLVGGFYPQRSSGQAVVTGVVPSSPRYVPSFFIEHRVQHSHCSSIFIECCSLSLSRFPLINFVFMTRIYSEQHGVFCRCLILFFISIACLPVCHRCLRFPRLVYFGCVLLMLIIIDTGYWYDFSYCCRLDVLVAQNFAFRVIVAIVRMKYPCFFFSFTMHTAADAFQALDRSDQHELPKVTFRLWGLPR